MTIDKEFLDTLFKQAKENPRLRQNFDMRTSDADNCQRMLNALHPGTEVVVHRHPSSSENVICLCGKMDEVLYEEVTENVSALNGIEQGMDAQNMICKKVLREVQRIHLEPSMGAYGCIVPVGTWHTIEVYEPSVIYEVKDGKYGEDGSETFNITPAPTSENNHEPRLPFNNSLGDLKKNIEYLIGMERYSGSMEVITPLYVSRMLHVPLEEVETVMKEMGI